MRTYNLTELYTMSPQELFALHASIVTAMNAVTASGDDRAIADGNLRRIRRVLANAKLTL